jgi:hypothetical protein
MHQQRRALNLTPVFLLALSSLLTSNILVRVTIGIGDVIHISNASALAVSLGFTSVFILQSYTKKNHSCGIIHYLYMTETL